MKMFDSDAGFCVAAGFAALLVCIGIGILTNIIMSENTERVSACVRSGGSWTPVQSRMSCVKTSPAP